MACPLFCLPCRGGSWNSDLGGGGLQQHFQRREASLPTAPFRHARYLHVPCELQPRAVPEERNEWPGNSLFFERSCPLPPSPQFPPGQTLAVVHARALQYDNAAGEPDSLTTPHMAAVGSVVDARIWRAFWKSMLCGEPRIVANITRHAVDPSCYMVVTALVSSHPAHDVMTPSWCTAKRPGLQTSRRIDRAGCY